MQTLVPIGTFENKARGLLGNEGFEAMLELLAKATQGWKTYSGHRRFAEGSYRPAGSW